VRSPELQGVLPEDAAAADVDQLAKDGNRRVVRELRKLGLAGGEIGRGACERQPRDLTGKARRVDQCHPAALAQAEEIDPASELIHQHVEIGEIIVDR
jgi:hypothetical protein